MNDSFESRLEELTLTIESTKDVLNTLYSNCKVLTKDEDKAYIEQTIQDTLETMLLMYSYVLELDQLLFFSYHHNVNELEDFLNHRFSKHFEKRKREIEEDLYSVVKEFKNISLGHLYEKAVSKYYELFLHITTVYHTYFVKQLQEYINLYNEVRETQNEESILRLRQMITRMAIETDFYDHHLYQMNVEDIYDDEFLEEKSLFPTVIKLHEFAFSLKTSN